MKENQNSVFFYIQTGDLQLLWIRLILFLICAAAFGWGLTIPWVADDWKGPLKIFLLPASFLIGMGALIQLLSVLVFYFIQRGATELEISKTGLSTGKITVPFDGLTSLFIGNKMGDKIEGRVIATPGAELESKMADQTYSLNVNTRGIEKRIVKSLNWHQAKYLLSEVKKAIEKVST